MCSPAEATPLFQWKVCSLFPSIDSRLHIFFSPSLFVLDTCGPDLVDQYGPNVLGSLVLGGVCSPLLLSHESLVASGVNESPCKLIRICDILDCCFILAEGLAVSQVCARRRSDWGMVQKSHTFLSRSQLRIPFKMGFLG